jgi:hypothetical protein
MSVQILHFSALRDNNIRCGPVQNTSNVLDLPYHVHAVNNLPERNVLAIKERVSFAGDKELAAVGIWTRAVGDKL